MKITIRYFAAHRDITGTAAEQWELAPGATVGMLWQQLVARYSRLAGYSGRLLYAVNEAYSTIDTPLHDGDEVAFIPPVSGGRDCRLQIADCRLTNSTVAL